MANTFDQTKTNFKQKVLASFMLSKEKKDELIAQLDSLTQEQMAAISVQIDAAQHQAKPLVNAGFASEKGSKLSLQLKGADATLKRNIRTQIEKEDRTSEEAKLEETLDQLNEI